MGTLLLTVAAEVFLHVVPLGGNELSIHAALRILRVKGFIPPWGREKRELRMLALPKKKRGLITVEEK